MRDELIALARQGDEAAWSALVDRYSGLLWSIARSYNLNEADTADLAQTVWLRLVERLAGLRDDAAVGGWLAVTARHEAARLRRPCGGRLPDLAATGPGPDTICLERERFGQVAAAIRDMPERCRRVLRFLALAPVTYAEIAAALDIPIGSVGPTRTRCLAGLRRLIEAA
jgi:RNA polymerase sigma factor (sigma-70 family)